MNIDMTEFGIGSILTIAATAGALLASAVAVVLFHLGPVLDRPAAGHHR